MDIQESRKQSAYGQWSNRILIASLIGIIYLTLFPFHFDFGSLHSWETFPFRLGTALKRDRFIDFLLNVLLFVPFGFGVSAVLRKRGVHRAITAVLALFAGALLSYTVEVLQFYIPTRNSGWDDIISNSSGAVLGFLILNWFGTALLAPIARWEQKLDTWPLLRKICMLLLPLYLGLFFFASIPLQQQTRVSNWDERHLLIVGNDATAHHPWTGHIARVQLWNRAMSPEAVPKVNSQEPVPNAGTGLLAAYEFAGPAPAEDRQHFLPPLQPISGSGPQDARSLDFDGHTWLGSTVPVADLTRKIKQTNQFTVRAVCTPLDGSEADQRIVSISQGSGLPNLTLRREGTKLVFWFRNPLSVHRAELAWYIPNVFTAGVTRDIVVSYDGSNATAYIDGTPTPHRYYLSPGAALAHRRIRLITSELKGYLILYDSLIFIPAGFLLGWIARGDFYASFAARFTWVSGFVLPPVILEFILVGVSGRAISVWQVGMCICFTILGAWAVNADRHRGRRLQVGQKV